MNAHLIYCKQNCVLDGKWFPTPQAFYPQTPYCSKTIKHLPQKHSKLHHLPPSAPSLLFFGTFCFKNLQPQPADPNRPPPNRATRTGAAGPGRGGRAGGEALGCGIRCNNLALGKGKRGRAELPKTGWFWWDLLVKFVSRPIWGFWFWWDFLVNVTFFFLLTGGLKDVLFFPLIMIICFFLRCIFSYLFCIGVIFICGSFKESAFWVYIFDYIFVLGVFVLKLSSWWSFFWYLCWLFGYVAFLGVSMVVY